MIRALFQQWRGQDSPLYDRLKEVPLFRDLKKRELKELEGVLQKRTFESGQVVFEQGKPGVGMYVVIAGEVEISQVDQGDQLVLTRVGDGGFFGETALLDDAVRTATAVAVEETEVMFFPRSGLLTLVENRPHLGVKVVMQLSQVIAERLRRANRGLRTAREEVNALQKTNEESE